jgi:hypothetical protein
LLQLVDISADGFLSMMNDNGDLREDLKVPDGDLGSQLKTDFENGRELLVIDLSIFLHLVSMINLVSSY